MNSKLDLGRIFGGIGIFVALIGAGAVFFQFGLNGPLSVRPARAADQASNPAVQAGRKIFLTAGGVGCGACHGPYAEGDVGIGPYTRGVSEATIRAALDSVAEMDFLRDEMNPEKIGQIAAFTQWLGNHQLVKTLAKRGRFIPDKLAVRPGTSIQLVISNASQFPHSFASDDMGIGEITVAGREAADLIWTAPPEEGSFTLRCTDCRIKGQQLTIEVSRAAPEFIPASAPPVQVARAEAPAQPDRTKLIEQGRKIFLTAGEVGCTACHGPYAEGDVGIGPYNRGFSEERIRKALKTVDAMTFLGKELSDEQITQVAAYYKWLGELQLVKARSVRGRFFPETIRIAPGTKVQLVIINSGLSSEMFASDSLGIEPFVVPGHDAKDLVWTAPQAEGTHVLRCTDCGSDGHELTIEVTESARAEASQ